MTDTKNIAECGKCGAIHVETRDCPVCALRDDLELVVEGLVSIVKKNNTTQGET